MTAAEREKITNLISELQALITEDTAPGTASGPVCDNCGKLVIAVVDRDDAYRKFALVVTQRYWKHVDTDKYFCESHKGIAQVNGDHEAERLL